AHAFLWAGRPEKAIEYLYGFANHAAPTGVWREEQPLRGSGHGTINGDMPHNWASAEFVRLVRSLLVFERGDELLLLPAVPAHWLASGRPIRVETPTRFGRVRLAVDTGSSRIEVDVAPGALAPDRVALHIPPGAWRVGDRAVEGPVVLRLDG
ncbi:MAG TPA: hypothetical protein VHC45_00025, partial [Gaiellaceae bacterium]|nr:hypothetical protein [Gaiellaceae bacterium]